MATLFSNSLIGTRLYTPSMSFFDGGRLDVYNGTPPANITDPVTGTLGLSFTFDSPVAFEAEAAQGGLVAWLYPPAPVSASASITPTYGRLYSQAGTLMAQVDMGLSSSVWLSESVWLNTSSFTTGQRVQLESLVFRDLSGYISTTSSLKGEIGIGGNFSGGMAELPRVYIDSSAPSQSGAILKFGPGQPYPTLEAAYAAANWGDRVVGVSGFDYYPTGGGPVLLPSKSVDTNVPHRWITIEAEVMPCAEGVRVTPSASAAANVWKLRQGNGTCALWFGLGVHHLRFMGFEVLPSGSLSFAGYGIWAGPNTGSGVQGFKYDDLPHHIVFDRMYMHGSSGSEIEHGLALQGENMAVVDSYLSDFHYSGNDAQAILAYASNGPFKIKNNYLEGLGENVMFGGGETVYMNERVCPCDIEIRGNTFAKNPAWYTSASNNQNPYRLTKTLLEFKAGKRVLIQDNVFENNWEAGGSWYAPSITMKTSTQSQSNKSGHWRSSDITIINNVIRRSGNMINWAPLVGDPVYPGTPLARIYVNNLLGYDMDYYLGNYFYGGVQDYVNFANRTYIFGMSPSHDAIIEHVTGVFPRLNGQFCYDGGSRPARRVTVRNCISAGGKDYPINGDSYGYVDENMAVYWSSSSLLTNNVIDCGVTEPGNNQTAYPSATGPAKNNRFNHNTTDNTFPYIGFNNIGAGDFSLSVASAHKGYATDGKDPGAILSEMGTVLALAGLSGSAALDHLTVSRHPSNVISGFIHSTQPKIDLRDLGENVLLGAVNVITASLIAISGTGTAGGTLSKAAVNGVVTFTDLKVSSTSGGKFKWRFTLGALTVDSLPFMVQPPNAPVTTSRITCT